MGQNPLIEENNWKRAFDLKNTKNENNVKDRLKNIYVCQFNQKRLKITPKQTKYAFPNNAYYNYVIPIYTDMTENDDRYTDYECKEDYYGYDMKNISEVDNRLITNNDRDWLYYSVGLRAGSKENINILLTLSPYENTMFEGNAKIQDGGRFTYWNPGLGVNAYMYFDNNVNTIISKRVDYELTSSFLPSTIHTFNTVAYQLIIVEDTNEKLSEYPYSTYFNSYGFGDSVVTIYVGGTVNTNCKLNPGDYTIIKITFYNNAGFDWNMYGGAIVSNDINIPKSKLMINEIHTVKVPSEYNFLQLTIPNEIKDYITITISDHMSNVANQVFDFSSNNVVSIIDGYEGNYFYKLKIKNDFPDKYKGRFWEIKIDIDQTYFDKLPGYNDPTGAHDYQLKIPSIKFGVPYPSGSEYEGKIFYTLGRGSNLKVVYQLYKYFKVDGIKLLSDEEVQRLTAAQSDTKNVEEATFKVWESISNPKNGDLFYEFGSNETFHRNLTTNTSSEISELPYEVEGKPDINKFNLLVKVTGTQAEYGYIPFMQKAYIEFFDGRKNKISSTKEPSTRYSTSSGPWITLVAASKVIVVKDDNGKYVEALDQDVYPGDAGTVKVTLSALNSGNQPSYGTSYTINFYNNVEVVESELEQNLSYKIIKNEDGTTTLILNTEAYIDVNTMDSHIFYLNFGGIIMIENNKLRNLVESDKEGLIKDVFVNLCQENKCEEESKVTQVIELDLSLEFKSKEEHRGSIVLTVEKEGSFSNPIYNLTTETSSVNIDYIFYRKLETEEKPWEIIQDKTSEITSLIDSPKINNNLNKYNISYRVEIYNKENFRFIASSMVSVSEKNDKKDVDDNDTKTWLYILIGVICGIVVIGAIIFIIIYLRKKSNIVHIDINNNAENISQAENVEGDKNIKTAAEMKNNGIEIKKESGMVSSDILHLK